MDMDSFDRECLSATAEAALASAAWLSLAPYPLDLLSPAVAAAMLAPTLLSRMPSPRPDEAVFAPDPLNPDFAPLASAIREMLEDAQVVGARRGIILTPLPSPDGGFAEYAVLWRPGASAVEVAWAGGAVRRRTSATVMPNAPMPIRVGSHPVHVTVSPDRRTGRAALSAERPPRPLRRLNPMADNMRSAFIAYLAALAGILSAFPPRRANAPITFAVLAAAPILIRRIADFLPRIRRALSKMKTVLTLCMMVLGNVFMTTAWYWHLRRGAADGKPLPLIVLMSWGIALLEYSIMVPANRIGAAAGLSVAQLKVAQEVITLLVFAPFAAIVLGERMRLDYLWAFLCLVGAVYFVNRSKF